MAAVRINVVIAHHMASSFLTGDLKRNNRGLTTVFTIYRFHSLDTLGVLKKGIGCEIHRLSDRKRRKKALL